MITTFDGYFEAAKETAIYPDRGKLGGLLYAVIGLGGESGELQNKVKKILRDSDGVISDEIRKDICGEIGDILWYLSAICYELKVNLGEIANWNIEKLHSRKVQGLIGGSGDNREIVVDGKYRDSQMCQGCHHKRNVTHSIQNINGPGEEYIYCSECGSRCPL